MSAMHENKMNELYSLEIQLFDVGFMKINLYYITQCSVDIIQERIFRPTIYIIGYVYVDMFGAIRQGRVTVYGEQNKDFVLGEMKKCMTRKVPDAIVLKIN